MAIKETLKHEETSFTFYVRSSTRLDFRVENDLQVCECALNKEACIRLATKLLNAAEKLS